MDQDQDFLYAPHRLDGFTSSVQEWQWWEWQSLPYCEPLNVCSQGIVHLLLCRDPSCMVSFLVQSWWWAASSHVNETCVWDAGLGISRVREGGREGGLRHSDTFSRWCRPSLSLQTYMYAGYGYSEPILWFSHFSFLCLASRIVGQRPAGMAVSSGNSHSSRAFPHHCI